jgi:hypothetical protein
MPAMPGSMFRRWALAGMARLAANPLLLRPLATHECKIERRDERAVWKLGNHTQRQSRRSTEPTHAPMESFATA